MIRLVLHILFITCGTILIGQEQNTIIELAKSQLANDQYEQAVQTLQDCESQTCQFTLADVYYRSNDYVNAKSLFNSLIEESYDSLGCHRFLSKIYEVESNYPKAIKHYLALAKRDTSNALYQRKIALLYAKSGYTLESIKSYRRALDLNPRDIISLTSLSEILFASQQIEEAQTTIDQAHQLDSTNIKVQLIRSKIAYKKRHYKEVNDILYKVRGKIDLDDYYSKIYGFSLVKIDSCDKAVYVLNKVLLNNPDDESVHYYLGLANDKIDEDEQAQFHYSQALKAGISKQTHLYHRKLAKMAEDQKDWPTAISHYRSSLDYKKNPEVYFLLAMATDNYYKDKSNSIKYYTLYLKSNHDNAEWNRYASERRKYLKEIAFLSKK